LPLDALTGLTGVSLGEVIVLENLASILHFLAGVVIALSGCPATGLAVYAAYQTGMTLVKFAVTDWYTVGDIDWDLIGDMVEFLAGMGLVWGLGLAGRLRDARLARLACNKKVLASVFGLVALYWTILLLQGWEPPAKP